MIPKELVRLRIKIIFQKITFISQPHKLHDFFSRICIVTDYYQNFF